LRHPLLCALVGAAGAWGLTRLADSGGPSSAPKPSDLVSIETPASGTQVTAAQAHDGITVSGRLNGTLGPGTIWVANRIQKAGQSTDLSAAKVSFTGLRCSIADDNKSWSCDGVYIGQKSDTQKSFEIFAVIVPPNAIRQIIDNEQHNNNGEILAPAGTEVADTTTVFRTNS
jgi:hypothetical protein